MNELSERIRPLTHKKKDGKIYERPPEIEAQISDALNLSSQDFMKRVRETDAGSPLYLREETLVYFYHQSTLNDDFELQEEIVKVLSERCLRLTGRRVKIFAGQHIEDCRAEIIAEVFSQLMDYDKASCSYSQIHFGEFLSSIAKAVTKKYNNWNTEDSNLISIEGENAETKQNYEPAAPERIGRQKLLELESYLKRLPQDIRSVYILHHGYEIQKESKEPNVTTLADIFGKTPRTIYNMLKKAEAVLKEMRGETE